MLDFQEIQRRLAAIVAPRIGGAAAEQVAAVFVLLVDRGATGWHVVFIRRADRGDPWSGQIAFPGGRVDADDPDPRAAAYRELAEELGVSSAAVALLGTVGRFRTHTRPVEVHAFLGVWNGREPVRPAPEEVAEVVELPWTFLCAAHARAGFADRPADALGAKLRYPGKVGEIWGVTARILHHLFALIGTPGRADGAGGQSGRGT